MQQCSVAEIEALRVYLTPEEQAQLDELLVTDPCVWYPQPGPQTMAYYSEADVVGFGGAAGGGKTDLAIGKGLTRHRVVAIFRRVGTELTAIEDRIAQITNNPARKGYNSTKHIWRNPVPGVQLELGSVPNLGDEVGYQGRPKDLLVFDEAANFLEQQVRFLMGWLRDAIHGQKCQALLCFNPPTEAEGRWIIPYFGPWLDKRNPNPAEPGELRYFAMVEGKEIELTDTREFVVIEHERVYDFDRTKFDKTDIIKPQSRTFIPSRVTDNKYLGASYVSTLQAMPEPLRSQMLKGDFEAGMTDSEWQVCPTAWVEAAMQRWKPRDRLTPMDQMGVDVARGGPDNTILARRHQEWYDVPLVYPGKQTPDGPSVAGLVVAAWRNNAPINVDVIGVGSSVYDFLHDARLPVTAVNVSEKSDATARSGALRFFNIRSQLAWQFREMLDPQYNAGIALPPDSRLKADLCAYTWKLRNGKIYVLSREEIMEKIGRSPDFGSAYFLASLEIPRRADLEVAERTMQREHEPYDVLGDGLLTTANVVHDPYANMN